MSRLRQNLLVGLLGTVLSVAALEGGLRLYAIVTGVPLFSRAVAIGPYFQRDVLLEFRLRPGAYDEGKVHINSRGFRGGEFTAPPRPGVYRIFAVGDSCTFGTFTYTGSRPRIGKGALRYNDDSATYPAMLETMLNSGQGAPRYEVINAGRLGYSTGQALLWLESEIFSYRPDLLIVYIGSNDLLNAFSPNWNERRVAYRGWRRMLAETSWGRLAVWLARRSATVDALYHGQLALRLRQGSAPNGGRGARGWTIAPHREAALQVYRANLSLLVRRATARKIKTVLMTLPTVVTPRLDDETVRFFDVLGRWEDRAAMAATLQALNRTVEEVGREEGAVVVDLAKIFASLDTPKLFSDENHTNVEGAARIADELSHVVRERAR